MAFVGGFIALVVIALFLGPLLHEVFHIVVLNMYGCYYTVESMLDLEAVHFSEIRPFCGPGTVASIIILLAGVVGNAIIGLILFLVSWRLEIVGKLPLSNFMTFLALGFSSDPLAYLFRGEGDLVNILALMESPSLAIILPLVGALVLMILAAYLFLYISECLKDYMSIREEIKEAEEFVKQIREPKKLENAR